MAARAVASVRTTHQGQATQTYRTAREPMTAKRPLNARNLKALGADRLAELLIQVSKGRTVARRLLQPEPSTLYRTVTIRTRALVLTMC